MADLGDPKERLLELFKFHKIQIHEGRKEVFEQFLSNPENIDAIQSIYNLSLIHI